MFFIIVFFGAKMNKALFSSYYQWQIKQEEHLETISQGQAKNPLIIIISE